MTVISIRPADGRLSCLAVGNVQAMFVRNKQHGAKTERDFVVLRGGVVGHVLPPLFSSSMGLGHGDMIILATDGIRIDFTTDQRLDEEPQPLANRLLDAYSVDSDDALVLTVRYLGGGEV
jgi:phosphoserine phosphatase RsbX